MNQDTIWQLIRYVLIALGSFFTARGWVTQDQWIAIVSATGAIFAALWGLYVKWDTLTVPAGITAGSRSATGGRIPTVSPISGQISG